MITPLVLALLAAAFVAVLPGWFWADALFGASGRLEKLVYSAGFSLALTSVVAYIPARILGTGITLPVAVASPLIVFASGYLVYRTFGLPEKKNEEKGGYGTLLPIRAPGFFTLLPLVPAAALILLWDSGALAGVLPLVTSGILVAVSGIVYLSSPSKGDVGETVKNPEPDDKETNRKSWVHGVVLVAVFGAVLVRGYIGPVLQDWPFVQGVDHYSHAVMANLLQSRGEIFPYLIYPPGFHAETAMVSRISGIRPLDLFLVLAPALFLLPALSIYVLGKRLFGWEYGALAAFFACVVANGPYIFYNDAMYPNLTTSEFLLVLAIVALVRLYRAPSWRSILAVALLGSAPVFFHQVASLYTAGTFALVSLVVLPYLFMKDRRRGFALFTALAILAPLAVAYGWDTYNITQVIGGYLGAGGESTTGSAVGQAVGTQLPYPPRDLFGVVLTAPVTLLGLLGVFFLFHKIRDDAPERVAAKLTVLSWTLVLCAGAATRFSGFPQRFAQDLVLPLSLLAALAAITIAKAVLPLLRRENAGRIAPPAALVLAAVLVSVSYWTTENLRPDGGQAVRLSYAKTLTITPEIAAAGEWLRENNTGGNIFVSPQANQVPSCMMLAMGEYPGYQSFAYNQLVYPRDLPPGGAEPLWQVLQVVNFPDSELSREITENRDIRYVVLYKYMPDRSIVPFYTRFAEARNDYDKVFENSDVVIYAPKSP